MGNMMSMGSILFSNQNSNDNLLLEDKIFEALESKDGKIQPVKHHSLSDWIIMDTVCEQNLYRSPKSPSMI